MGDPLDAVVGTSPTETNAGPSAAERRIRWFEVVLILLVACGGSLLNSLYLLKNGPTAMPPVTSLRWTAGIVHEISCLLLLGYVLARRKLNFASLGLRWSFKDAGVGLLVTGLSYVAYAIGAMFVHAVHYSLYGSLAAGPTGKDFFAHPPLVAIPFSLLNPFFEELIVRAYLMTEAVQLTGSATLAVALSVLVQFSYHLYYGWAGALSLAFLFLTLSVYYARTRRALPVIVAHGFFDIYAMAHLW